MLGSCSGQLCSLFRIALGTGENQSSTKRSVGAISPTFITSSKKKKKCFFKLSSQLYSRKRLVEEPRWSLPHLPLRGNVRTRSGLAADSRFHHQGCVFCAYILTLHINPLFSFHLSLISHLMSNFFTGWIIYNSFTIFFFFISVGRNW